MAQLVDAAGKEFTLGDVFAAKASMAEERSRASFREDTIADTANRKSRAPRAVRERKAGGGKTKKDFSGLSCTTTAHRTPELHQPALPGPP